MDKKLIDAHLRAIPDFPKKGINFWDVDHLFNDPTTFRALGDELYEMYKDKGITKIVALESRGFVSGSVLADRIGAGFVMVRKKGKLPGECLEESYTKEYGEDTIEIHADAIAPGETVLIHDDLLATGGTMGAAYRLVQKFHPAKVYFNVIIDIVDCPRLEGFTKSIPEYDSLIEV